MLKIMFLDDSLSRIKEFKKIAKRKLKTTNIHVAKSASDAIRMLKEHKDFEWIFLDHDLGLPANGRKTQSKFYDLENCGLNVVLWMIDNDYPKLHLQVVVHSWNLNRGLLMALKLREHSYAAKYIPGAYNLIS